MALSNCDKYELAKSLTELAIQHNLVNQCNETEDTAKEVANFFNAIVANIDDSLFE